MKKILFPLVLSLILILPACSAAGSDTVYTFSEEDGYGLAGMDYGGSVEELNKVLGCTLSDTEGVIGTSEPDDGVFIGEITEFLGTKGYFDAQFTDGDTGFYSVTFHTNSNYGDPKRRLRNCAIRIRKPSASRTSPAQKGWPNRTPSLSGCAGNTRPATRCLNCGS